jgi:hypothetical protein
MQSSAACSPRARRPASVPWSWHEHPGGERSVDVNALAKKCHGTETETGVAMGETTEDPQVTEDQQVTRDETLQLVRLAHHGAACPGA